MRRLHVTFVGMYLLALLGMWGLSLVATKDATMGFLPPIPSLPSPLNWFLVMNAAFVAAFLAGWAFMRRPRVWHESNA